MTCLQVHVHNMQLVKPSNLMIVLFLAMIKNQRDLTYFRINMLNIYIYIKKHLFLDFVFVIGGKKIIFISIKEKCLLFELHLFPPQEIVA